MAKVCRGFTNILGRQVTAFGRVHGLLPHVVHIFRPDPRFLRHTLREARQRMCPLDMPPLYPMGNCSCTTSEARFDVCVFTDNLVMAASPTTASPIARNVD